MNILLLSLAPSQLWLNLVLIVVGVAVVVWGADRMTEGSVAIAERLKVPKLVIGLTIVALGTSMPEFFVSLVSALKGTSDLAVGNVVGSNIFNTLLIVGVAALVTPIAIDRITVKRDMPVATLASLFLFVIVVSTHSISRFSAAVLLAGLFAFMYLMLRDARKKKNDNTADEPERQRPVWLSIAYVLIGLTCLVVGGNVFVDNATAIAQSFGVSEAVIGLTIVAGGTSMPELATSVVAARKGQSEIAIGNVLGSNVINILFILGTTGMISPMQVNEITTVDLAMLIASIVLLYLFSFTKLKVERWEGGVLTAVFAVYMAWLLMNV